MRPASAKAKGRRLQNQVAEDIRTLPGLVADDVKPAIMSESGMDIHLSPKAQAVFPFAVECKNVEKLNLWKAYDQAGENAGGLNPLVVLTKNGRGTLAVVEWGAFLSMVAQIERLKEFKWMYEDLCK